MKLRRVGSQNRAFTALELMIVVAVVLILFLIILPMRTGPGRPSPSVRCMSNLRQISMAMQMFAEDNHGQLPQQLLATNSADAEFVESRSPAICFNRLRPYLSRHQVWVCPTDKLKTPSGTNALDNRNVSYFLSLSATVPATNTIVAGDRHLAFSGQPISAGTFVWTTNSSMGWTRELHPMRAGTGGVLAFADAHVQFTRTNVATLFAKQGLGVNRLAIP